MEERTLILHGRLPMVLVPRSVWTALCRYLAASILLLAAAFCTFGFLAVWEVSPELRWIGWLIYGSIGLGCLAGVILLLTPGRRRAIERNGLDPRNQGLADR
jgi:hypothetical protein